MKNDWPAIVTELAESYRQRKNGGWVYLAHAMSKDGVEITPAVLRNMARGHGICSNPDAIVWLWEAWRGMQQPQVVQQIVGRKMP